MKTTGVFLPDELFQLVESLLEPTVRTHPDSQVTYTIPGNTRAVWKVIDEFAMNSGLPDLGEGVHYVLSPDHELIPGVQAD